MKSIFLFAISALLLAACVKNSSDSTTTTTTGPVDTTTIVDNGTTYTYLGGKDISCQIEKTPTNSTFFLSVDATAINMIDMTLDGITGPLNSLGIYKVSPVDSPFSQDSRFTETFSGGENYSIDSIMVDITTASGTTVIGNYELWLTNAAGSKTVTGRIYCLTATIE